MPGVARPVDHGNEPAQRVAQDDRPSNADGVAEGTHVVGAHLEAPGRRIAPLRTAVAAQVEVDDLRYLRQASEVRLQIRVVETPQAPVPQDGGGALSHRPARG